jgi:hypothetical protein
MSMINRYKKKGGFIQLLNLIETTAPAKAQKFLQMIAEENPAWEAEIRKKSISLDRLSTWNQSYLMEVMPRLTPNVIASAIGLMKPEKQQVFLGAMPFSERRKAEDLLKEKKPNPGESASSQIKIINEIRGMAAQGALKFEKVDPDLVIPENIEDLLNAGHSGSPPTNKEIEAAFEGTSSGLQSSAAAGGSSSGRPSSEELQMLRKKIVALTQENQLLKQQLQTMKEKLDSIRKSAA